MSFLSVPVRWMRAGHQDCVHALIGDLHAEPPGVTVGRRPVSYRGCASNHASAPMRTAHPDETCADLTCHPNEMPYSTQIIGGAFDSITRVDSQIAARKHAQVVDLT